MSAPPQPPSRPPAASADAPAAPRSEAPVPPVAGDPIDDFPIRYAATARFSLGSARNLTVVADGARVLFCRSPGGDDPLLGLWCLEVDDDRERLLVDPADLASSDVELPEAEKARRERARESAAGIVAYATDKTGDRACFALGGSLFVVDVATGEVTVPEAVGTVFDPRLAPDGSTVAYVDQGDLRLLAVGPGGVDRVLRTDPDPAVSHGRADFIAAEEMGRQRGFWWSPDSDALLVTRVDESAVAEWWISDPARPDTAPTAIRYPAAGTANATVGLELVPAAAQSTAAGIEIDWSDGGRYHYLADVQWRSGQPPLVVRQTRDQRRVSVAAIDPATGAVDEVRVSDDDTWVDLVPGSPRACDHGLLTIEDDGPARRLLLDGRALTGDGLQVRSLVGLARDGDDRDVAVVTASPEGRSTEVHLHAIPLPDGVAANGAGSGAASDTSLTSSPGVHHGAVGGSTLVVVASSPEHHRPVITVGRLGAGEGRSDRSTIADHSADPGFAAEPVFCNLGPDRLATALFLPSGYDGAAPLPVLLDPYGGPHAQRVLRTHNAHLVSRWFAEQGYAVVVADGRGTPGRGPAWERAVAGNLADPVLDDQLAALDAALERHPFLDGDRVGIRGWSFGGYLSALAVLRRPDRFHAAIAGAPVTSWRLYDTHYTERYLGHPDQNPAAYDRSDLWVDGPDGPELPSLQRPLLLIHGLADDNVVSAHTLRFSSVLVATGSPHRVLPLVGVTHMTPQLAVAENLLRLQLAFLDETLAGGDS